MRPEIAAVVAELETELANIHRRAVTTAEGAVHQESRAEDPKDTRGLEASYLAHGLAQRAGELEASIKTLRYLPDVIVAAQSQIISGLRFGLEDEEGASSYYLMLPCAGGTEVCVEGTTLRVVTPTSPLGRAVLGRREGDDLEVRMGGRLREFAVISVG